MERRRFSQTMASEWQTAFVVSHKMPWCALLTAVKNYNKSLENAKSGAQTKEADPIVWKDRQSDRQTDRQTDDREPKSTITGTLHSTGWVNSGN